MKKKSIAVKKKSIAVTAPTGPPPGEPTPKKKKKKSIAVKAPQSVAPPADEKKVKKKKKKKSATDQVNPSSVAMATSVSMPAMPTPPAAEPKSVKKKKKKKKQKEAAAEKKVDEAVLSSVAPEAKVSVANDTPASLKSGFVSPEEVKRRESMLLGPPPVEGESDSDDDGLAPPPADDDDDLLPPPAEEAKSAAVAMPTPVAMPAMPTPAAMPPAMSAMPTPAAEQATATTEPAAASAQARRPSVFAGVYEERRRSIILENASLPPSQRRPVPKPKDTPTQRAVDALSHDPDRFALSKNAVTTPIRPPGISKGVQSVAKAVAYSPPNPRSWRTEVLEAEATRAREEMRKRMPQSPTETSATTASDGDWSYWAAIKPKQEAAAGSTSSSDKPRDFALEAAQWAAGALGDEAVAAVGAVSPPSSPAGQFTAAPKPRRDPFEEAMERLGVQNITPLQLARVKAHYAREQEKKAAKQTGGSPVSSDPLARAAQQLKRHAAEAATSRQSSPRSRRSSPQSGRSSPQSRTAAAVALPPATAPVRYPTRDVRGGVYEKWPLGYFATANPDPRVMAEQEERGARLHAAPTGGPRVHVSRSGSIMITPQGANPLRSALRDSPRSPTWSSTRSPTRSPVREFPPQGLASSSSSATVVRPPSPPPGLPAVLPESLNFQGSFADYKRMYQDAQSPVQSMRPMAERSAAPAVSTAPSTPSTPSTSLSLMPSTAGLSSPKARIVANEVQMLLMSQQALGDTINIQQSVLDAQQQRMLELVRNHQRELVECGLSGNALAKQYEAMAEQMRKL